MTDIRVLITGMGLITPLGSGVDRNWAALLKGETGIGELTLFPTANDLFFPVGEVTGSFASEGPPRTHQLALMAAEEAVEHTEGPPDAIIMGSTTGGMNRTEALLKEKELNHIFAPMDLMLFLKEIKKVKINDKWYVAEITKKIANLLDVLNVRIT